MNPRPRRSEHEQPFLRPQFQTTHSKFISRPAGQRHRGAFHVAQTHRSMGDEICVNDLILGIAAVTGAEEVTEIEDLIARLETGHRASSCRDDARGIAPRSEWWLEPGPTPIRSILRIHRIYTRRANPNKNLPEARLQSVDATKPQHLGGTRPLDNNSTHRLRRRGIHEGRLARRRGRRDEPAVLRAPLA